MALSLSVPVVTRPLPAEVDVNPKKARAWIESLPLTKTIDSARAVIRSIEALNAAKMPGDERVAVVEIYRPVVTVLLDELQAVYAYSSLPLPAKQAEAFDLSTQLITQCCYAYKMQLLEKTGKMILFNARKSLPGPLFWSMYYLRAQMLQSYKVYYPVPHGVWQEMHQLQLFAEEQGLTAEVVDAGMGASAADLYADALMMSLADPYRLMYQEADKALDLLKQNRGLVEMRTSAEGLNPMRLFVVAMDSDQPPKVLVQGGRPPPGQLLRIVDPGKLVEKLQQRLRTQTSASAPSAKSRATHDLTDLMGRLIRLWGDPPKRQFRRNPTDSAVALCAGIKAICYFTELASQEDPEADARAIREGGTIPLLRIPQDPMSQMIGVEEWHVLNQSANGLRMHRESGGSVSVTVGEVVGVRFVGGRTWNVGVVRWLTMLEGNALEFGVELVAPAADSITIEPTIGGGRSNPALRLLSLVPEAESDTLLTIPETFADLREFELKGKGDVHTVRATTLMERTSRFDMFQYQES